MLIKLWLLLPTFITDSSYGKYNTKSFVSYKSKSKYSIDIGTDNKSKYSVDYKSKYLLITNRTDFHHPCPSLKPACGISPASPILAPWGWPSTGPGDPPSTASPSSLLPLAFELPASPEEKWRQPGTTGIELEPGQCRCSAASCIDWRSHLTDPPVQVSPSTDRDDPLCSRRKSGPSCGDLLSLSFILLLNFGNLWMGRRGSLYLSLCPPCKCKVEL